MPWTCSKCGEQTGKTFFQFFNKIICPRCLEFWVTGEIKVNVIKKKGDDKMDVSDCINRDCTGYCGQVDKYCKEHMKDRVDCQHYSLGDN